MYRLSEDIYNKLGREADEEFKKCISAKERGEDVNYRKMNAYICLEAKVKALITDGLQNIAVTGWFE